MKQQNPFYLDHTMTKARYRTCYMLIGLGYDDCAVTWITFPYVKTAKKFSSYDEALEWKINHAELKHSIVERKHIHKPKNGRKEVIDYNTGYPMEDAFDVIPTGQIGDNFTQEIKSNVIAKSNNGVVKYVKGKKYTTSEVDKMSDADWQLWMDDDDNQA